MASPERMSSFVISSLILFNFVFLLVFMSVIENVYARAVNSDVSTGFKCQFEEELSKSSCKRTVSDRESSEINSTATNIKDAAAVVVHNITVSLCQVLLNVSEDVCKNVKSDKPIVYNERTNVTCKILSVETVGFNDWGQTEILNLTKDEKLCNNICSKNENLTHICNALVLWFRTVNPVKNDVSLTTTKTVSKNDSTTVTSTVKNIQNVTEHQEDPKKTKSDHEDEKKKNEPEQHKEAKPTSTTTSESTSLVHDTTSNSSSSSSKVSTTSKTTTNAKPVVKSEKKVEQKVEEEGEEADVKIDVLIKGDEGSDAENQNYDGEADPGADDDDDDEETNIPKESSGKDFSFEEPSNARPKVHPIGTFSSGYDDGDSHFFIYFLTVVGMCIAIYVLFHNKQKILAIIVEGRQDRRSRRPNSNLYRKLDTNLDEVIQDNRPKNLRSMSNIIY